MSTTTLEIPSRNMSIDPDGLEKSNLGPLLPYMEKQYWMFVGPDLIEKAKRENKQVFLKIYFSYDFAGALGKNGYGLMSLIWNRITLCIRICGWIKKVSNN